MASNWLIYQLADSAFPTGGFAHSSGLESAWQLGEISSGNLAAKLREILWQAGRGGLPLAIAAHAEPAQLPEFDSLCDSFLSNHVSNRASRLQGRAFLSTCERSFPALELHALRDAARKENLAQHFAPVFGATLRLLDVELKDTRQLFMYWTLRGAISAAVRLGIVGPHQAQQIQNELAPIMEHVLENCGELPLEELSQTAPLLDLFQMTHDRLYSRLFQS